VDLLSFVVVIMSAIIANREGRFKTLLPSLLPVLSRFYRDET
jgi:hypothetical protein